MPTTLSDHVTPQPDPSRLCPQCHAALVAVQIEIAAYRPAQTVWLCANCLYALDMPVVGDGAPTP